uniref:Uncharacterized protein n=1 Tax=Anguilla anguilla TaxID=7936 RepID=A0A0E9Q9V4_ANGAN
MALYRTGAHFRPTVTQNWAAQWVGFQRDCNKSVIFTQEGFSATGFSATGFSAMLAQTGFSAKFTQRGF